MLIKCRCTTIYVCVSGQPDEVRLSTTRARMDAAHDMHQRCPPCDAAGGVKTPPAYSPSHRVGEFIDGINEAESSIIRFV